MKNSCVEKHKGHIRSFYDRNLILFEERKIPPGYRFVTIPIPESMWGTHTHGRGYGKPFLFVVVDFLYHCIAAGKNWSNRNENSRRLVKR